MEEKETSLAELIIGGILFIVGFFLVGILGGL